MKRGTIVLIVGLMTIAGTVFASPRQASDPAQDWLGWINHYRALSNLPPVSEDPALSDAAGKHARYMAENGILTHDEDPDNFWYTPEGAEAGRLSEITSGPESRTPRDIIENWASEVFHGTWLIDPRLSRVGFGLDRGFGVFYDGAIESTAPASTTYPIVWPADGESLSITTIGNEVPDPKKSCPGHAGAALKIAYPASPNITSTSLTSDGSPVAHCSFNETNYMSSDPPEQTVGRFILQSVHMVAVMPRDPLVPGKSYTATVVNGSQTTTWTFWVVDKASVPSPVVPTPPPTLSPSPTSTGPTASPTNSGTSGTTSIDLSPSSKLIRFGKTLSLHGEVDQAGCSGPLTVRVSRKVLGSSRVEPVSDDIEMIGLGSFEFSFPADFSAVYTARVLPGETCARSTSTPKQVLVRAHIRASGIEGCPSAPSIEGKVLPDHPRTKVLLNNSKGRSVDRDRLDRSSGFTLHPPKCGVRYRIEWPSQDESNTEGFKVVS